MESSKDMKKQFNEMEDFLKLKNHLNILLSNFGNINTADRNDLFDILYIKRKLSLWLEEDIENQDVAKSIDDMLEAINIITESLTEEQINKILDNKLKIPEQLNKVKYNKKEKARHILNKSKIIDKPDTNKTLKEYLVNNIMSIASCLVLLVGWDQLSLMIVEIINCLNCFGTPNEVVNTTNSIQEVYSLILNSIGTLLDVVVVMLIVFKVLETSISILYISSSINMRRALEQTIKFCINPSVIDMCNNTPNILVPEDVATMDRLEYAEILLNNMMITLSIPGNKKQFKELAKIVKTIRSNVNKLQGIDKIEALVDAEITYEKLENSDGLLLI